MMISYLLYRLAFLSFFMACLTQLKYNLKKTCGIIGAFIFILWAVNFPIYMWKGTDFFNYIWPLTVGVPALICFFLLSRLSSFQVLFSFFTVCNFGMLTSFAGFLSLLLSLSPLLRILSEAACGIVLLLFLFKLFRKPYFKVQQTLEKGWALLCAVPVLLCVILYLLLYYPTEITRRPDDFLIVFLVFILLFAFYATVYLNFENISQYYQLKHDNEWIRLQTEQQKKEYHAIMDKVTGTQIYRHDMRHQINIISAFLNDNNISEAQKYLNQLNDNFRSLVIEHYCANYGINCILSSYISRAKAEQIQVHCEISLPEKIKVEEIELGLVFANSIENAIHACIKIEDHVNRKISVACREHHDQIYIQVCNTYAGEVVFDGEFPVSDRAGHGYGTRSIAATAEKYSGIYSFAAEKGIFKTTVILNSL